MDARKWNWLICFSLAIAFVACGGSGSSGLDNEHSVIARVVVQGSSGTFLIDATLPPGAYSGHGSRGWQKSFRQWAYRDTTSNPIFGIRLVTAVDDSNTANPGRVRISVVGMNGGYQIPSSELPLKGTIALSAQAQTAAGQCGETAFGSSDCTFLDSNQQVLRCQE